MTLPSGPDSQSPTPEASPPEPQTRPSSDAEILAAPTDPGPWPPDPVGAASPPPALSATTEVVPLPSPAEPGPDSWFVPEPIDVRSGANSAPAALPVEVEVEVEAPVVFPSVVLTCSDPRPTATISATASRRSRPAASWLTVLLASYASALTIAGFWLWRTGRIDLASRRVSARPLASQKRPDPEMPALLPDHLIDLGGTGRFGQIEIVPVSVRVAPVTLRHQIERDSIRDGKRAWVLTLRLRNLDSERGITPLEPGALRATDQGPAESFIEDGRTRIEAYPLSIQSEWELDGQVFPRLRPGEEAETILVSQPDVEPPQSASLTWRVRLRVGERQTELVGIRFRPADLGHPL